MNNNNDIKVFYIDLDGTSLDVKKNNILWLSDENLAAIKKVRSEGKEVIISTGRLGKAVSKYVELINSKYSVTGNGAQIIDRQGKVLREFKLSIRQVLLVLDFAQKHKLVMKVDDNTQAHGVKNFFQGWLSQKFHFEPVSHYNFELHKERIKIVVWGKTKGKIARLQKELQEYVDGVCVVSSSNGWTLEITHEEATKGKANEYVSKNLLNIPIENTAHLGDTMNDSTVVGHVGKFIVMGNASNELKKLSKYHGPNYKKGGMAKVLNGEYKIIGDDKSKLDSDVIDPLLMSGKVEPTSEFKTVSLPKPDEITDLFGELHAEEEKNVEVFEEVKSIITNDEQISIDSKLNELMKNMDEKFEEKDLSIKSEKKDE